jgi:hypothetical protein
MVGAGSSLRLVAVWAGCRCGDPVAAGFGGERRRGPGVGVGGLAASVGSLVPVGVQYPGAGRLDESLGRFVGGELVAAGGLPFAAGVDDQAGRPAEGLRHRDPAFPAGAEQPVGLGVLGVGGSRGGDVADAGGDEDGPAPGLGYAVVGGVEDPAPHGVAPAAEDGRVLLPQGQHVGDFFHEDRLGRRSWCQRIGSAASRLTAGPCTGRGAGRGCRGLRRGRRRPGGRAAGRSGPGPCRRGTMPGTAGSRP